MPVEGNPPRPARRVGRDQRRLVLLARVQQKPPARLDDRPHPQPPKQLPQRGNLLVEPAHARRQGAVVDRDRHAAIADLGQQFDRVEQVVMGQTVGVVAKEHGVMCRWYLLRENL